MSKRRGLFREGRADHAPDGELRVRSSYLRLTPEVADCRYTGVLIDRQQAGCTVARRAIAGSIIRSYVGAASIAAIPSESQPSPCRVSSQLAAATDRRRRTDDERAQDHNHNPRDAEPYGDPRGAGNLEAQLRFNVNAVRCVRVHDDETIGSGAHLPVGFLSTGSMMLAIQID